MGPGLTDGILSLRQMEESREVNNSFPEALKEPILRRIQFSTVSRLDNLGMLSKDRYVLNPVELTLIHRSGRNLRCEQYSLLPRDSFTDITSRNSSKTSTRGNPS